MIEYDHIEVAPAEHRLKVLRITARAKPRGNKR
jgi:hypothetical protein